MSPENKSLWVQGLFYFLMQSCKLAGHFCLGHPVYSKLTNSNHAIFWICASSSSRLGIISFIIFLVFYLVFSLLIDHPSQIFLLNYSQFRYPHTFYEQLCIQYFKFVVWPVCSSKKWGSFGTPCILTTPQHNQLYHWCLFRNNILDSFI